MAVFRAVTTFKNVYQKSCMSIPQQTHDVVVVQGDYLGNESMVVDRHVID